MTRNGYIESKLGSSQALDGANSIMQVNIPASGRDHRLQGRHCMMLVDPFEGPANGIEIRVRKQGDHSGGQIWIDEPSAQNVSKHEHAMISSRSLNHPSMLLLFSSRCLPAVLFEFSCLPFCLCLFFQNYAAI